MNDCVDIQPTKRKSIRTLPKKTFVSASAMEITRVNMHDDRYNMDHAKRGKAVIFNHYAFDDGISERQGTHKDEKDLKRVLEMFDFDVTVYIDLTSDKIDKVLHDLAEENHSKNDCLLIAVMSHGEKGTVYAKDRTYPVETLWEPFRGDKCPSLAGKPKIFLIQACRGEEVDNGISLRSRLVDVVDGPPRHKEVYYRMPSMADFLVMYATFEGFYAWRSTGQGSWFIQAVCQALEELGCEKDLVTVLTTANRYIAVNFQSNTPQPNMDQKKQIGTIVSTCTRLLYLNKSKNNKQQQDMMEMDSKRDK